MQRLARLLREGLKVLFVDEPTRGIDAGELAARGLAMMAISSEPPEQIGMAI